MRPRGGRAKLAVVLTVFAVAVGAAIAAVIVTRDGHVSTAPEPIAPTTGSWVPLTVTRPNPVQRTDFSTTLFPLPAKNSYRMTIFNTSNLGAVNAFQWYPPAGVRIVKMIDTSDGRCTPTGPARVGGNQFPKIVLYQNLFCDQLDLKPPSCTCLGDGGSMTISFVTNTDLSVGDSDIRVRAATLPFDPIATGQDPSSPNVRHVKRIVTATSDGVDSGGLTAGDREAAQSAMDALQDSNISLQLVSISQWLQNVPAACRIRLVSRNPSNYEVYVFWIPWLAAEPYAWLNMTVTSDPEKSTFRLGTVQPVLPGGRLKRDGRSDGRQSVDTTFLSRSGPEQAKKGRELLVAHGGGVFAKPGATCQVLKNGSLRLLPDE